MSEKEIKNLLLLIAGQTAENEARRQSRWCGSELISMRLGQRERLV